MKTLLFLFVVLAVGLGLSLILAADEEMVGTMHPTKSDTICCGRYLHD